MPHKHQLLFAICYYTSSRVAKALKLQASDFIGDRIVFWTSTKKKKQTREVEIPTKLAGILRGSDVLGYGDLVLDVTGGHLSRKPVTFALRKAWDYISLRGITTDSLRRTSLTKLYDARVPLRRKHAADWIPQLGTLCQVF